MEQNKELPKAEEMPIGFWIAGAISLIALFTLSTNLITAIIALALYFSALYQQQIYLEIRTKKRKWPQK